MTPTRRSLAVATLSISLVVLLAFATPTGATEEIEEMYRITTDTAEPANAFEAFDAVTLATFDLNGDGTKEIITHNDNNNVYVFDGATGELIAELETNHPDDWEARELAGPSIGDVSGNGITDIVISNSAGWVTVFEARPAEDPNEKLTIEKLWEKRMDPREQDPDYTANHPWADWEGHPALDGSAYLADATDSGSDEIYLQLDDMPSLYALDGTGEVRWWNNWSDGNANPIATDFTGDGNIEAMYPSDGGLVLLFDAEEHYPICTVDVKEDGPEPASISVAPTVADITNDGAKEIIFGVRNATDDGSENWYTKPTAHFYAIDSACEIVWDKTWEWANPHVHMHPVPVDVTGNGSLDVVFQDWNTIGHQPGDWQQTGASNLLAIEGHTGDLLWQTETRTDWSNKNIALGDISGDGIEELLVVESRGAYQGIAEYNLDGEPQDFHALAQGWNISRGATVIDLTGDGNKEMILPVYQHADFCERDLDVGCRAGGILVYSTPGQESALWPNMKTYNHAYEYAGEPLQTSMPDANIEEQETPPGTLALHATGELPITAVHVKVPGTDTWQQVDHAEGDRYEGELRFSPAAGDTVDVRLLFDDGQATFTTLQAQGDETLLRVTLEDQDGAPIENGTITVNQDDTTVWSGEVTSDGKIQIPVDPGVYTVEAAAQGFSSEEATVNVEQGEINEHTFVLSSGFLLGLSWVGVLGGTGVIALGLISAFLAMRKWSLFS